MLIETADCLLWKARVREVDGALEWKFDVPLSGLRQRLFEAAKIKFDGSALWSGFNLPELATMNRAMPGGVEGTREELSPGISPAVAA